MKKIVKIKLHRFCSEFDIQQFRNMLSFMKEYEFIEDNEHPDLIVHSTMKGNRNELTEFKTPNVFFMMENWVPNNLNKAQWIIHSNATLNLPKEKFLDLVPFVSMLYAQGHTLNDLLKLKTYPKKSRFCNFLFKVNKGREYNVRDSFYDEFSKYRQIDAPGKSKNNMENIDKKDYGVHSRHYNKLDFISEYKFTIGYENQSVLGYICEKLTDPMFVGSIPIYWGSPLLFENYGFNTKSFIYRDNYSSNKEMINHILKIDKDNSLYEDMLNEPWFYENKIPYVCSEERIKEFWERIIKNL